MKWFGGAAVLTVANGRWRCGLFHRPVATPVAWAGERDGLAEVVDFHLLHLDWPD